MSGHLANRLVCTRLTFSFFVFCDDLVMLRTLSVTIIYPPALPATRSLAGPNPWLAVDKPGFETTVTWTPGMAMDAQTALAPLLATIGFASPRRRATPRSPRSSA